MSTRKRRAHKPPEWTVEDEQRFQQYLAEDTLKWCGVVLAPPTQKRKQKRRPKQYICSNTGVIF